MDLARNLIQRVNIGDSLTRSVAVHPGSVAVVDGDRSMTYAEFNAYVNRIANGLAARGYGRHDALALASGNSLDFLAVYYACAKIGVVAVPINLGWRNDEVAYVLDHSGARGLAIETQLMATVGQTAGLPELFTMPGLLDQLDGGDAEPDAYVEDRDPITYLYTSGTTSFPKGCEPDALFWIFSASKRRSAASPKACPAPISASTWNRCRPRWTRAGTPPTGSWR